MIKLKKYVILGLVLALAGLLMIAGCSSGEAVKVIKAPAAVPAQKMCASTTCSASGIRCGNLSNRCGGTLNCGICASGSTCTYGVCVVPPVASNTCVDGDMGVGADWMPDVPLYAVFGNPYVASSVSGSRFGGRAYNYTDACVGSSTLLEQYCVASTPNSMNISCPCSAGACIR